MDVETAVGGGDEVLLTAVAVGDAASPIASRADLDLHLPEDTHTDTVNSNNNNNNDTKNNSNGQLTGRLTMHLLPNGDLGAGGGDEERRIQEYLKRSDTAVIFPEPVQEVHEANLNLIQRNNGQ